MDVERAWHLLEEFWQVRAPPTWIMVSIAVIYAWYKYHSWYFGVFKKIGVPGPKPWPMLGTGMQLFQKGLFVHDVELKKQYGNVVGCFLGRNPNLMIYDPELIKMVTVKEFASFPNRYAPPEINEYPLTKMLGFLKDERWKHVRNTLTPTFSSGKLRKMTGPMSACSDTFLANLQQKADSGETFDFRELCGAYTMDVIASTAFSLQIDSHNDPKNQFVTNCNKLFQFSLRNPKIFVFLFFPFLVEPLSKLGISAFPSAVTKFFTKAVDNAMSQRRQTAENQDKVDFLQLMVNAENENSEQENGDDKTKTSGDASKDGRNLTGSPKGLTHEEVLAQGIMFLIVGFETTASTISFLGYSLATNPECQDKLCAEIDEVLEGKTNVTYDELNKLPYLDMCISETLRLYPTAPRTDRIASCDITINGLFIPKGMIVGLPVYALHHDPEYWESPEKFDPERFTPEAKAARNPYVYLPFGVGPRNCIGMRLALMEVKMAMVKILQKFQFVVSEETQIPMQLEKLRMRGTDGIKLRVKARSA